MVYLLYICDTLPLLIHPPQPDLVYISDSVVMYIEISDPWCDISGRGRNVEGGGGSVPGRHAGGSG